MAIKCKRCAGCGRVWGSGDEEIPASEATKLPYESIAPSIALGAITDCPACGGSGNVEVDDD